MILLPAIDLYGQKAVRLYQGDYGQMTVYSEDIPALAKTFQAAGAEYLHMVDLEGAKDGTQPHFPLVASLAKHTGLKIEIGGGIRTEAAIARYLEAGVCRVILGTAAITDWDFLCRMVKRYGKGIAVGVDCKDGLVAIHGWQELSQVPYGEFCQRLAEIGVQTVICTDISKDGAMQGTNLALYRELKKGLQLDIIASGGVSTLEDVKALAQIGVAGAIVGKAYYTGAIDLAAAIRIAK